MKKLILSLGILVLAPKLFGQAEETQNITGKWLLELNSIDVGIVKTLMGFETSDTSFTAHTRKHADRDILGWWVSLLARTFTDDFKKGSLLRIVNGKIEASNDTSHLSGIFTSAMGNYHFNATVASGRMEGKLTNSKGVIRGRIEGRKERVSLPLEDYHAVYQEAMDTVRAKIFDPNIFTTKDWRKFDKKMKSVSAEVQDDLELVFAFFYYAGKLPISHFALMKPAEPAEDHTSASNEPQVVLEEKSPSTMYMKVKSFGGSAAEMDSVMDYIIDKGYKNLIVDLRNNPGGSVAAGMSFATSVADTTFFGGVFLTQKWFEDHKEAPSVSEYEQFPHFTEANFDLIIEGIHKEEGLCLKVVPQERTFSGNLFLLTNSSTASTCEPIAYGLKQHHQATLVGETTAGAMLNGEVFQLNSGFSLVVPTATYYTSDGFKIDQNGVSPDIETSSEEALDYVMRELIEE